MGEIKDLYNVYLNYYEIEDSKEVSAARDKLEKCMGKNYTKEADDAAGSLEYFSCEQGFVEGFRYAAALLTDGKATAAIKDIERRKRERADYIDAMPFSMAGAFMEKATEAADLFKYANIDDSLFCERMMKLYGCVPLESDKGNLIAFLITLFNYGKVQGIRSERAKRKRGIAKCVK